MDINAVIAITGGLLIVLIPVAGITARFALKPIVDSVARLREIQGGPIPAEVKQLEDRLARVEQQVQAMDGSLRQLQEARDFERQLQSGRS